MEIAPSMLSCNFAEMGAQTVRMDNAGADYMHLDVMDGHFVPNLTFGAPIIKAVRPYTKKPFDVHLMISEPLKYIDDFADAGADIITFHVECDSPVEQTIRKIKARGLKAGLSVKPGTPIEEVYPYLEQLDWVLVMTVEPGFGGQSFMGENLSKVKLVKEEAARRKINITVEIDGGVNTENIQLAAQAGVDICVAGTAVFKASDPKHVISCMKSVT